MLTATIALASCATEHLRTAAPRAAAVELRGTPFFPQEDHQCGPAALATVLTAGGIAVTPAELAPQMYIPGREGSLQQELIAATRTYNRVPYVLEPRLEKLLAEVAAGRPVLVLQNLGLAWFPVWHYAVVIGFDPAADEIILRSGRDHRRVMSARHFIGSWERAGSWALLAVETTDTPVTATPQAWIGSVSAFESLARPDAAATAYRAATQRWPDSVLAWQALGNALYAVKDWGGAAQAFESALRLSDDAATHNNLAQVRLEQGCAAAARPHIEQALKLPAAEAQRRAFEQTREAIIGFRGRPARDCPRQ